MTEVVVRRVEQEAPFGRSEGLLSDPAQRTFRGGVGPGSDERFRPPETVVSPDKKWVGAEKEIEVECGWIGNVTGTVVRVRFLTTSGRALPLRHRLWSHQQRFQRPGVVLKEPASNAPQEGVGVRLELMRWCRTPARANAEDALFQESLVHGSTVSLVEPGDDERQLDVPQSTDADLHGVPQLVCEEEEGGRVLEALLPEEGEGVLEGGFPPPLPGEVVAEERRHSSVTNSPVEVQLRILKFRPPTTTV